MNVRVIIFFTLFVVLTKRCSGWTIPISEYESLADLYYDNGGQNWAWRPVELAGNVWNFSSGSDPCTNGWQGLQCSFFQLDQANIVSLNLSQYGLVGSLSPSIGNLTHLEVLDLDSNAISGIIPDSIGGMAVNLTRIDLSQNWLIGTIPANMVMLPRLNVLQLFENDLTGSIPDIYSSSVLEVVDISFNGLQGTIAPSMWSIPNLQQLILRNNHLTGTFPAIPETAHSLKLVDAAINQLSGTLPTLSSNLTNLEVLSLFFNYLTGTLHYSVCTLSSLRVIYLNNNAFSGTLSDCIFQMTRLEVLLLNINAFTGHLPDALLEVDTLSSLWLQVNQFSGPMPDLSGLRNLAELSLEANLITGSIAASVSDLTDLAILQMQANYFTGSLPALSKLSKLNILEVGDNFLTGCVPQSLSLLPNLIVMAVQNNFLSCTLEGVFNSNIQSFLTSVEINNNRITGTLPVELFLLPNLSSVVAQSNCITGTMPASICSSKALQSLVLDGLHTSRACRVPLFEAARSYILLRAFHGTIPSCIFALPNLVTLHLSGNALTGTIPNVLSDGLRMENLVLSHNALSGALPDFIQTHHWNYLDLSYNRIGGVLHSSFGLASANFSVNGTHNTIYVDNNRLSGVVPSPLLHMSDISVLGSNLFACAVDKRQLPRHDSDRDRYQCGSNAFDGPYFAYLALFAVGVLALVLYRRIPDIQNKVGAVLEKWRLDPLNTPRNINHVCTALTVLSQLGVLCTILIILVLVPLYLTAGAYVGTYTHEYAWRVSAAYLSSAELCAVEFVLYCLLMVVLMVATRILIVRQDQQERSRMVSSARGSHASSNGSSTTAKVVPLRQRALVYIAFLAINVVVVVGVNVTFVYVALTQSNGVVFLAQLLLSVFKLMWNTVCTPYLIYLATNYMSQSRAETTFVTVQVFIGLFNNIAIPCLVVAAVSPSCFYSAFDTPASVDATVIVSACLAEPLFIVCGQSKLITSSYEPPFHYSYQCSSSFITYYAPAFVYLGIVAGMLTPCAKIIGVIMLQRAQPGTFVYRFWRRFVPRILAPLNMTHVPATVTAAAPRNSEISVDSVGVRQLSVDTVQLHAPVKNLWSNYKPYFDANNLIISVIIYLGILLTFGVVFPPLAFVMCVTIISVAWQAKISVGRFICNVKDIGAPTLVDLIEQECRGAISLDKLRRSMFAIILFCCFFYALFLFDTLGDAVGVYRAYWVLIVMPLVPFCLYAAVAVRRRWMSKTGGPKLGVSIDIDLYELSMVGMKPSSPGSDAGPAAAAGPPSGAAVVTSALHQIGEETGDDQL